MIEQTTLTFPTPGRGTIDITADVHDTEGPDDMAADARSILTSNSMTIPVADGKLMLGTWQGLYLYEHRHAGHARSVVVTLTGEA